MLIFGQKSYQFWIPYIQASKTKLIFINYHQRAYEYIKLQQGEDINFNDDISNIRETSRQKFNDLVAFNSKFKRESNLGNSELNRQSSEIVVEGFKEHIQAEYIN